MPKISSSLKLLCQHGKGETRGEGVVTSPHPLAINQTKIPYPNTLKHSNKTN